MRHDEKEINNCLEYARVSTDNEGQAESCKNQIILCDAYVEKHPELNVVGRYVDDGISGSTGERPQFEAMLSRVRQGDIRYIIAKNESRLCRSTEVDAYLRNLCILYDVKIIYTESGNIYDPKDNDFMLPHGIMALVNEHYVHNQSKMGKMAHKQKCKERRLNATDVRYGYYWDKEKKCMAVNDDEAAIVRQMFEWYVYCGLGVMEIAKRLAERGVYGARSGKMLTANTVSARLADASYKGVFYINKKGSDLIVGMNAKKKRFSLPKEDWVAVDGPAIVSEELFDMAQKLREERRHIYDKPDKKETQARFKGTHLFSGKVFCGECGTQFHFRYADRKKTIGEYKDFFAKKKRELDAVCNNKMYNRVYEKTLIDICRFCINTFLKNHETCIENLVDIIKEASIEASQDNESLQICQKRLAKVEKELNKNMMAWRDAPDDSMKEAFLEMYKKNKEQKETLEKEIENLSKRQEDIDDLEKEILGIREHIEKLKEVDTIDRNVVENFIDRIIVYGDGKIMVVLKFGTTYKSVTTYESAAVPQIIFQKVFLDCFNLQFIPSQSNVSVVWSKTILPLSVGCSDRA